MNNEQATRILIVDDAKETIELLARLLSPRYGAPQSASSVAEAIKRLEASSVDLVISDLKMPGTSGLDLVSHVRQNYPNTEVIVVTGYATIGTAVEAIKGGAEAYLAKPFTEDELYHAVDQALNKQRRRAATHRGASASTVDGIVGESAAMREVYDAIAKTATVDTTVLISGESGVGKELVARAIHYQSARASAPFLPINCGAIPEELFESELFGHIRGAFSGATHTQSGFFQAADGGTIFLDEVSELRPSTQVKLLRILQDGEVWMVGTTRPQRVDVRVIAATNRALADMVETDRFRRDLYFRLRVIDIVVPPLRDRGNDVLLLADYFAQRFAQKLGRRRIEFTEAAWDALSGYAWPGNVRELENLVHRLTVMSEVQQIDVPQLPSPMRYASKARLPGPTRTLAAMEAAYIEEVLASVDGNKTRAAEILGVDRKTLRQKLRGGSGPISGGVPGV